MRSRALALLGGLLLLVPAAAVAQSAGDKQYSDPFAGKSPSTKSPTSPPTSQSVPSNSPSLSTPDQLASGGSSGSSSSSSSSSSASSSGTLPRTGLETGMLALMGGLMLIGGVLLRLGLRPLPVRAAGALPPTLGRDVRLRRRPRRRRPRRRR